MKRPAVRMIGTLLAVAVIILGVSMLYLLSLAAGASRALKAHAVADKITIESVLSYQSARFGGRGRYLVTFQSFRIPTSLTNTVPDNDLEQARHMLKRLGMPAPLAVNPGFDGRYEGCIVGAERSPGEEVPVLYQWWIQPNPYFRSQMRGLFDAVPGTKNTSLVKLLAGQFGSGLALFYVVFLALIAVTVPSVVLWQMWGRRP